MVTAKVSFERVIGETTVVVKLSVHTPYGANNTVDEQHALDVFTGMGNRITDALKAEIELERAANTPEASGAGFEDEDENSPFTGCGDPNCCRD